MGCGVVVIVVVVDGGVGVVEAGEFERTSATARCLTVSVPTTLFFRGHVCRLGVVCCCDVILERSAGRVYSIVSAIGKRGLGDI